MRNCFPRGDCKAWNATDFKCIKFQLRDNSFITSHMHLPIFDFRQSNRSYMSSKIYQLIHKFTEKICFGKIPELIHKSGIRRKFRSYLETFRIILWTFDKCSATIQKKLWNGFQLFFQYLFRISQEENREWYLTSYEISNKYSDLSF